MPASFFLFMKTYEQIMDEIILQKKINQSHFNDTEALKNAERILKNTFLFNRRWDMERCLKAYTLQPMDWLAHPNEDEEWCFMLNRMDYLKDLALASQMTGDKKYLIKAKELIFLWLKDHSEIKDNPSTRTLDTGIRLLNFYELLPYLKAFQLLTKEETDTILSSMKAQILYLKKSCKTKYTLSNWGSIQMASLVIVLPLFQELNEEYKWAKEELKTQLEMQIYPDGMHWEQSTMYHVEVLNSLQKVYYYVDLEEELKVLLAKVMANMTNALKHLITPKMKIEAYGDSDEVGVEDVLLRSSFLLKQKDYLSLVKEVDGESFFAFGQDIVDFYQKQNKSEPKERYYDGIYSGIYTIRSSWDNKADYLMFLNSSLGSGHGHSDNLHFSLFIEGKPILIDSGRYSYREDCALRPFLKSQRSHNSLLVDDKEICVPKGSWSYNTFAKVLPSYVHHEDGVHYLEGTILSENPLEVWTRKLVFIEEGICLLVDQVHCQGEHKVSQFFHFDSSITSMEELNWYHSGSLSVKKDVCSKQYNQLEDHFVAKVDHCLVDEGSFVTCFYPQETKLTQVPIQQGNQAVLSDKQGLAYEIKLKNGNCYTIAFLQEEIYKGTKILFCRNVPFHAKAVVIHKKQLYRLRTS
ncbi:alginate lyase family protein [Bulleidia sp. zg-1006]|uniref:alginate lyase family protein n=1 Tax=Bulleidia sp. zg-1006 TaxID=2806552 RepID=UPI001939FF2F|nr:alginate lyase family protein [Bulleidia sp. zg-1006]QRG86128.1 alginate lyase family protein [Bulleidia sp. zg-1006]